MTTMTRDVAATQGPSRTASGLGFAAVSALSFGLSGALARPLLESGWSPGAATLARAGLAMLVVLPFAAHALRGRWGLLRRNAGLVVTYGLLAVAAAQFCYFAAIQHMQVGPALLIEYTAPAAVVVYLWLRKGQRPGATTLLGAGVAALGLLLVLDLLSGSTLSLPGVLWALAAMVGVAAYFVISADEGNGLPPMALAGGGLVTGTAALALLAAVGLMPVRTAAEPVTYAGWTVSWWLPLVLLGLLTAALAYTTGIAASRRLGSRVASFVALSEVVAGVAWAWLLLDELPRPLQLLGGALILVGVVFVKLGERGVVRPEPTPA